MIRHISSFSGGRSGRETWRRLNSANPLNNNFLLHPPLSIAQLNPPPKPTFAPPLKPKFLNPSPPQTVKPSPETPFPAKLSFELKTPNPPKPSLQTPPKPPNPAVETQIPAKPSLQTPPKTPNPAVETQNPTKPSLQTPPKTPNPAIETQNPAKPETPKPRTPPPPSKPPTPADNNNQEKRTFRDELMLWGSVFGILSAVWLFYKEVKKWVTNVDDAEVLLKDLKENFDVLGRKVDVVEEKVEGVDKKVDGVDKKVEDGFDLLQRKINKKEGEDV